MTRTRVRRAVPHAVDGRSAELRDALRLPESQRARSEGFFGPRPTRRDDLAAKHQYPEPPSLAVPERFEEGAVERSPDIWGPHWATVTFEGRKPNWPAALITFLVTFVVCVGLGYPIVRARRRAGIGAPTRCEVRCISLGFDWRERGAIQETLRRLAAQSDMRSADGMHDAAGAAVRELIRALPAARYAAVRRSEGPPRVAESAFHRITTELKARYRHDVVERGRDPSVARRAEEGEGWVIVSLVVGVTRLLPWVPVGLDRETLGSAMSAITRASPDELVALEVVWSPAVETDRMSSLELETLYPELQKLDPDDAAGARSCGHCGAARAGEIAVCPACGSAL